MRSTGYALGVLLSLSGTLLNAQAPLSAAVDSVAAEALRVPVAGFTVAVARHGEPLLVRGYGLADLERGEKAAPGTVYEIGSTTKSFTAAAVLLLAEEGKLSLDDPLAKHLPAFAAKGEGITLRHLLSHTSGLFSENVFVDAAAAVSPAAMADTVLARPVESAPGERFRYNNHGYVILGLVVERLSGRPYADFLAERFFRPLAMASTAMCGDTGEAPLATGYVHPTRGPRTPTPVAAGASRHSFSAGGLCSTAEDLLRWQHALVSGRVLRPESFARMTTPATLASGKRAPYGLGMEIGGTEEAPRLHHGGATLGFVSQMSYYPESGVGVVVLTNGIYAPALVDRIERGAARAALGLPLERLTDLPLGAEERARYAGTYDLGPVKLEVYEHGDHLRAQPPGQVAARLLYQGDDTFVAEHDPRLRLRFRMEAGRAAEMIVEQGGRAMPPARRVR